MKILWSEASGATLAEVGRRLVAEAKPFRSVTMADLVAARPEESVGLYFFFDRDAWAYVGKAASRAFIERVPSHLDVRPEGWFGTLLKKLGESQVPRAFPLACVKQALDLRLALLVADLSDIDISSAEDDFRHGFLPVLNAPRRPRTVDLVGTRLSDFGPSASAFDPCRLAKRSHTLSGKLGVVRMATTGRTGSARCGAPIATRGRRKA